MPMPNAVCDAAQLVPATADSPAHTHRCNRYMFNDGSTHLGEHHCGDCGASFTLTGPDLRVVVDPARNTINGPLATEKCQACGAVQPMDRLREMHPEPDVTQYVCVDTVACSARVKGRREHDQRWPLNATPYTGSSDLYRRLATPVEPAPVQDPAQVEPGLSTALRIVRSLRNAVAETHRGRAEWMGLHQQLAELERQLIAYRPPTAELTELRHDPGLHERVTELETAVAHLIQRAEAGATPLYVHHLLDAYLTGEPLDFHGAPVPLDVQRRLARPLHRVMAESRRTEPHPPEEMVWLGDLSGYEIDVTEDGPNPQLLHRCGWHVPLQGAGCYLANIIHDQVRTHMRDGCQQP